MNCSWIQHNETRALRTRRSKTRLYPTKSAKRVQVQKYKIKCGCFISTDGNSTKAACYFFLSSRTQTWVINHHWLSNYGTLRVITYLESFICVHYGSYCIFFAFKNKNTTKTRQPPRTALQYRVVKQNSTLLSAFKHYIFIFFFNNSNWFPTGWIISLLTCILLWPIKVTPVLGHKADLGNACKSCISSPAHSK